MHARRTFFTACLLIVLGASPAFAQATGSTADNGTTLLLLDSQIASKEFLRPEGIREMQAASQDLTATQRQLLFTSHRKDDALLGLVLNFVFPGLGSIVQSDWGGGAVTAGLYVVGVAGVGLAFAYADTQGTPPFPAVLQGVFLYGGGALFLSAYAVGIIRPFAWVAEWNRDLAAALGTSVAVLDLGSSEVRYQPDARGQPWSVAVSLVSFRY